MPTAKRPHVFTKDPENPSRLTIDYANSENYKIMEAYGWPRVVYAQKANKYYKNMDCTKEFDDEKITEMGLTIPIQIQTEREKLIKEQLKKEPTNVDFTAIFDKTMPGPLKPPKHIRDRLAAEKDGFKEERMINRLNRQTLGRS